MKNIILILQIVTAIGLVISILLQAQGTGLGTTFGEGSEQYRSKRGVEKLLYKATVMITALFLVTSILNLLIK